MTPAQTKAHECHCKYPLRASTALLLVVMLVPTKVSADGLGIVEIPNVMRSVRLPQDCTRVAFDIGTNDGADTVALATHGFCVVSVDANPEMIQLARKHIAKNVANFHSRVRVANIGISESPGNLTFYVTPSKVHSSFEYSKARSHVHAETDILALQVPTQTCEWLWRYLPAGVWLGSRYYLCWHLNQASFD